MTRLTFIALLAVAAMAVPLAGAAQGASASSTAAPITPAVWVPFAAVAILVVMGVAAIVYALSSVIVSPNARNWSRIQIYEALLSLILLLVFGSFSYLFFINPYGALNSMGMIPPYCASGLGSAVSHNIFSLSVCDLSLFNNAAINFGKNLVFMEFAIGLVPSLEITIRPPILNMVSLTYDMTFIPNSLSSLLNLGFSTFFTLMILNQLQLLLLAGSLMFLSFFVTLGLVARTLGFSRSFGGAMIALGLGLGLIYPLLTCITYGFVNTQGNLGCLISSSPTYCIPVVTGSGASAVAQAPSIIGSIFSSLLYLLGLPLAEGTLSQFINWVGYFVAGISFLPYLNFLVVDAFIIDFSSAMGERMDFMSLLTGLV